MVLLLTSPAHAAVAAALLWLLARLPLTSVGRASAHAAWQCELQAPGSAGMLPEPQHAFEIEAAWCHGATAQTPAGTTTIRAAQSTHISSRQRRYKAAGLRVHGVKMQAMSSSTAWDAAYRAPGDAGCMAHGTQSKHYRPDAPLLEGG